MSREAEATATALAAQPLREGEHDDNVTAPTSFSESFTWRTIVMTRKSSDAHWPKGAFVVTSWRSRPERTLKAG